MLENPEEPNSFTRTLKIGSTFMNKKKNDYASPQPQSLFLSQTEMLDFRQVVHVNDPSDICRI